jgi:2-oxoglutarate dehydrogenase E2 component (dihydrolipoamide succinyltransferase)
MPTEITMPQLGESVPEGTVRRWLKQPGEPVEQDEPLLEITTDKIDTELPAPAAGTLLEICVPAGATVRVGTRLGLVGEATELSSERQPERWPSPNGESSAPRKPRLSPVVARMVAAHDLDVAQITGTGVGGRVSKQDVLRFLEQRQSQSTSLPEQPPAPPDAPAPIGADPPPDLPPDADLLPLTPQRRVIAEHMLHAVRTIPHVTTVMEVDLSRVLAHREQQQAAFAQQGVRLTLTAYLVQAAVSALAVVPSLNGRFTAAGIVQHRRKHIGVAVALSEGLIVPVIHDADEKNLLGLARAVGDLTARARNQRLRPDETQGGTFTITNHGVSGSLFATPIINQGQGGILGVGAVQKRPVVITQGGSDAIAIRPVCYCSLTFDHRLCDGATADAFLSACKRFLEAYG